MKNLKKKPETRLQLVTNDSFGEPFLIMSVRDAISREVADFLDLVPAREEALHLLLGAIDRGIEIYEKRPGTRLKSVSDARETG